MATTEELKALLADAETQYHELMLGRSARVYVDQNGERVEYTSANAPRLKAYIAGLKTAIAGTTEVKGPLRAWM